MIRRLTKMWAEALVGGGLGISLIRLRGRSLVLGYHNVVAAQAEAGADASLHVGLERLRSHLNALLRTHRVVPLDELLEDFPAGSPQVSLTFDDAYRGVVRYALPELRRRGLPATLFVVPGHLDRPFWWDRIQGPEEALLAFRDHVLNRLDGDGDAAIETASRWGLQVAEPPSAAHPADEAELRSALENPGVRLGSHSWTHRNLATLDRKALDEELRRPREWLEARFDGARLSRWIAYPYGLYDTRVERALRVAGYRGGLRIEGGCLARRARSRPDSVARVNVPAGLSAGGLRLRAAGLRTG